MAGLVGACASSTTSAAQSEIVGGEAPPFSINLGPSEPGAGADALDGGVWSVIRLNGADTPPASAPTLAFQGPGVTGSTGCNRFFGQVSVTEAGVRFTPMGVSRRACEPHIMDLESDFLTALRSVDGFALYGDDRLMISAGADVVIEAER